MKEEWRLLLELLAEIIEYLDFTVECPADSEYISHMRNLLAELSQKLKQKNDSD